MKRLLFIAMMAVSLIASAETDVEALLKAEKKGSIPAARELTEYYFNMYDFDQASAHLDKWDKLVTRDKKATAEGINEMRQLIMVGKNMLERVEKITIIDSIVVDKADFFNYYRLTPDAGNLLAADALPAQYATDSARVVYRPQLAKQMFWSRMGQDNRREMVCADVLDNGSLDEAKPMGKVLNEGGDADYLFMESDGMTFYYANNGENSFGGYDIFMSRRQPDGTVMQPQNIGMPYNSPYDDYMMAIDEMANIGWWATDRNQIPDKLTIYVFIPNANRINYDPTDILLADYAFVRSISATQRDMALDASVLFRMPATAAVGQPDEFYLSMGNGKIYTNLSQFNDAEAAGLMETLIDRQKELNNMQSELAELRTKYASGDKSVQSDIQSLEKRVLAAKPMIKKLANQVISLETRQQ